MLPRHLRLPLLVLGAALVISACGEEPASSPALDPEPAELTWFALGGDAYTLRAARSVQTKLLTMGSTPRWFVGPPELVSEAELERRRAAAGVVVEEARVEEDSAPPGMRWMGTTPPMPRRLRDIDRPREGARLWLRFADGGNENELHLELTLRAGQRPLWRQTEHRSTNVLPFLFTMAIDGVPYRVQTSGASHFGGSSRFERLVEAGEKRSWTVRVDTSSLPVNAPGTLSITALFCERKHTGWAALDGEHPAPEVHLDLPFEGDAALLRSNTATLTFEQ